MEENNSVQKKINPCALVSFIFSLVGIIVAGLPCGIVATITGIIGLVTFKEETQKGKGFAIAGLVIGIIDVVIMVIYIFMNAANVLSTL